VGELRAGGLELCEASGEALPHRVAECREAHGRVGRDAVAMADEVAVVAVDDTDDPQPSLAGGDL